MGQEANDDKIQIPRPTIRGDEWPAYGHDQGGMRYSPQ